jgi:hypothetical protein
MVITERAGVESIGGKPSAETARQTKWRRHEGILHLPSYHFCLVQGALDGGLNIPHKSKRFVGYDPDAKEFDADTMRKYIYGGHVAEYMAEMEEEEPEKFRSHFKNYLDNEVEADEDEIEEMYKKVRNVDHITRVQYLSV